MSARSAVERVRDRIRERGGDDLAERLEYLDAVRKEPAGRQAPPAPPGESDRLDFDVVVAGGGLWSLLPPLLAARGLRVAVVERSRAAQAHREWNASGPELEALVTCGLLDPGELEGLVVARYDHGVCRFAGGGSYPVRGVLDHAVDAQSLLSLARAKAERLGVTFLDGHSAVSHASSARAVRLLVEGREGRATLTASVLVDARGAASPYARADLVCPTVGGVVTGLEEGDGPEQVDPRVGEILATVDGVDGGRQHVWEAFPGRPGETTVYVFYYARATEAVSLQELYARFFDSLSTYKRAEHGEARLLRPTFGFIPGWSRLSAAPSAPDSRVVLVGDAAARHSPLTYCGFGATLRSLARAARAIEAHVERGRRDGASADELAVDDAPIHSLTGALAIVMASRAFAGDELNALLDAAFAALHQMGDGAYAALLRDEMPASSFATFLRITARRHPRVWQKAMRALGPREAGRWALNVARTLVRPGA